MFFPYKILEGFLKNDFGIVLNYNKCELNFNSALPRSELERTGISQRMAHHRNRHQADVLMADSL